jgi:CheY-like chemotaxis protein
VARTRARRPRSSPSGTARSRRRGARTQVVLIVEDEPDLRVLAESNIADFGYATLSAASGKQALALLEEHKNIALLFTDINLTGDGPDAIDGVELARRAVEEHPDLRVIYTTGGIPTDGMTALFVDAAAFLQKPYTRDQLRKALEGTGAAEDSA